MKTLKNIFILLLFIFLTKISLAQCCGNGICEPGETPANCPYDCASSSFNCANTVGSFFNSTTWPVNLTTAQTNGWCYTFTPAYPGQVCFEYRVPNLGDSASVSFSISACGGTSINQSNYPPLGGCNNAGYSSTTITGVSTYDNNCNLVSSAITTGGPGCYTPGDIITICLDINPATTCPQITVCPVIYCGATNCATTSTPPPCPPFNFTDSAHVDLCDSTNGYAVVTPDCGSHFTYQWDDPLLQTDSFAVGLAPGTYNVTITNTAFNCDTVIPVTIGTIPPPADASWDNSDTICEAAGIINLNPLITGTTGGTWSGTGVTGSNFDPTGLNGSIPITYIVGFAGCPDTLTQNIIVQPNVDPGLLQNIDTVCEASGLLNLSQYETGTTGGTWSGTGVTGSNFDPFNNLGNNVLTYIVGNSPCTESSSITINVQPSDTVAISYNSLYCLNDANPLANIVGTSGGVFTISSPGVLANSSTGEIDLTGTGAGSFFVYYSTFNNNIYCGDIDSVQVIISPDFSITLNDSICQGDSILLGGVFQNSAGNYYDTLQTINGCDSIIETVLVVNSLPTISTSSDTTICNGLTVNISALGGNSYIWDNGLGAGQNHNVSPSTTTTYLVVGSNSNGCSDTSTVTVTVEPLTLANAGPDQELCDDITSFTLNGNQPLNIGETGLWTTTSGAIINNPNMANTNGTAINAGANIFTWTISSGTCPSNSDTVIIDVENCDPSVLIVPNVFTPNGDGMNDIFTITSSKIISLNCEVYNRWGQKLYYWEGVKGFWDGRTTAGVEVPDGTYFYLLNAEDVTGESHFKKGSFSLIR
jgi:gliding motility-associated-like protein